MQAKPTTIDEYLAAVSADKRAALEKLRKSIKTIVPRAEECINYGVAAFRLDGTVLVGFGAAAKHCTFFPMSGSTLTTLKNDVKNYDTSKGALRFPADKPLPAGLVRKVIKTRLAEIAAKSGKPKKSAASASKRVASSESACAQSDPAVVAFLRDLDHPLKADIEAVRQIILGVSPEIREGIKWNAPSFRTADYFATFFLSNQDRVQLIFHRGAKVKDNTTKMQIPDPTGLIEWLATDRCMVTLGAGKEVLSHRTALEKIVKAWIRQI